jgi:8-oxo-dGTP pyrophosphatase MutT (NUDIX family)
MLENEKGEILGLKNPDTSGLAGYYDLPGGRIDIDEADKPYEEIIRREIREELGTEVEYEFEKYPIATGRHIYFSKKLGRMSYILMVMFRAKYLGGDIHISDEHIDYKWIDLEKEPADKYFTKGFLDGVQQYMQRKNS